MSETRSQLRLQALDFWLRNPDYLADELLNEYELTGDRSLVEEARAILDDREPEIRRLPMTKYMFGAYEPLDNVPAPLVTYGLVQHAATAGQARVREHDYWFMPPGEEFAQALLDAAPAVFDWYVDRAKLVARVAGSDLGGRLKERQYHPPPAHIVIINAGWPPLARLVARHSADASIAEAWEATYPLFEREVADAIGAAVRRDGIDSQGLNTALHEGLTKRLPKLEQRLKAAMQRRHRDSFLALGRGRG